MARFDHLEFETNQDEPVNRQDGSHLDRDDQYWLRMADQERRQGFFENALRYYSRALEKDKSLLKSWLGQVQMLIQLSEHPEAELWSRKALELFRNNSELLAGRAQAYCRLGDLKKAQELCDAALRQEGQSAYRWTVRGELMARERGDIDRHCFDKALNLDDDWLVPAEIACIYLHYRNPSKALIRARQAVERAPDSPYCWYLQGFCEMELALTVKARESFKRCLQLSPNHAEARSRLAQLANQKWSLGRTLRGLTRRS